MRLWAHIFLRALLPRKAAAREAVLSQCPSGIARFRLGSAAFVHENLAVLRFERLRTRQVFRNTLTGIARFRLGSAAFVHENLASLRFSVSLRFYIFNNHSKKAKPRFCLFPPICRRAFGKRVNFLPFIMCVPLKRQKRGRNRRFVGRFLPQIAEICFNSLKQISRA